MMFTNNKSSAKKPENTAFKQQRMKAWQPLLTPGPVIISFFVIGIVFIPIGAVLFTFSNALYDNPVRYDDKCGDTPTCEVTFENLNLKAPVYMYYKLDNFYQNHRRYTRSRNDNQLAGVVVQNITALTDCEPRASVNGSSDPDDFYLPCGLIAWSQFNDSFVLRSNTDNTTVPLRKNGIAWSSDLTTRFNNPPANTPGVRVIADFQDEDFVVWMRTAGMPNFRKLYRIIDQDLQGNFTVFIRNNFPVREFEGAKYVVLAEVSWMGGKNPFLGIAYLVVGGVCFLLGVVFLIVHLVSGRKLGDTSYLNWQRS